MKKLCLLITITILLLAGCGDTETSSPQESVEPMEETTPAVQTQTPAPKSLDSESITAIPTSDNALYEHLVGAWKNGTYEALYAFADDNIKAAMDEKAFSHIFSSVSDIGGALLKDEVKSAPSEYGTTYSSTLQFEHITVDLTLIINQVKISGISTNLHFQDTFEIPRDGYTERYFMLENDGYRLRGVYTYCSDGQAHPAALLVSGSGPNDYDETVGLLTPFKDMAQALAHTGVNSLRIDKRTYEYSGTFQMTDTIDEEYLSDCNAAIDYLNKQPETASINLIGHSLGGQIVTELAKDRNDIQSMIVWNSTARNLLDIMADQLSAADPANAEQYRGLADAALSLKASDAVGQSYLGLTDYYCVSLNEMDVIQNIKAADTPCLILNSTKDLQTFPEDLELWRAELNDIDNVEIYIDEQISHLGYELDMANPKSAYTLSPMPAHLVDRFVNFLNTAQNES